MPLDMGVVVGAGARAISTLARHAVQLFHSILVIGRHARQLLQRATTHVRIELPGRWGGILLPRTPLRWFQR